MASAFDEESCVARIIDSGETEKRFSSSKKEQDPEGTLAARKSRAGSQELYSIQYAGNGARTGLSPIVYDGRRTSRGRTSCGGQRVVVEDEDDATAARISSIHQLPAHYDTVIPGEGHARKVWTSFPGNGRV